MLKIWSKTKGAGKIAFPFRLASYSFGILLVLIHHIESDIPLSTFDYISIIIVLLLPFILLIQFAYTKNHYTSYINHLSVDFFCSGWFAALLNLSILPSAIYILASTSNYIAAKGFKKLYRFLWIPTGFVIAYLIDRSAFIFEYSELMTMFSLGYGAVHFLILSYISYLFAKNLKKKNAQIEEQQREIKFQAEELLSLNENLTNLNLELELKVDERTKELKLKNEKLAQYAFINAHKLRAPVATMQGLINLLNMNGNVDKDLVIEKISETMDILDLTVTDIRITLEREMIFHKDEKD